MKKQSFVVTPIRVYCDKFFINVCHKNIRWTPGICTIYRCMGIKNFFSIIITGKHFLTDNDKIGFFCSHHILIKRNFLIDNFGLLQKKNKLRKIN